MSSYIIVDGDRLQFSAMFGENSVTPTGSLIISGSGEATIENKPICIAGDEKKVSVSATYTKGPYVTPGQGTITITNLAMDQQAEFVKAKTPIIVEGSQFTALFTPSVSAQNPSSPGGPTPDLPLTPASGSGTFNHSQTFVTAG